jgi:dTDP-4-dehydrorhamnose reductase
MKGLGYNVTATSRRGTVSSDTYYLDLENFEVSQLPSEIDAVVICAGVPGEQACQANPELARRINVRGTQALIDHYEKLGVQTVFLSSTEVFDGSMAFPPVDSPVCPRGLYGEMKAEVERFAISNNHSSVLRVTKVLTPLLSSPQGWSFGGQHDPGHIKAFTDVLVSPVTMDELCEAIALIVERNATGVFQLGSEEEISFYALAQKLFSGGVSSTHSISAVKKHADTRVEHNSLQTWLPTREDQYQPLSNSTRFQMGLMSGHAYLNDPKRLSFTLSRYKFVSKMFSGLNNVLEVGCADAFGTPIVMSEVTQLTATDFDATFISDARKNHPFRDRIRFLQHDMLSGPVDSDFDGVYALDVLEHINPSDEHTFLANLVSPLTHDGVCIIGMPSIESQVYASDISKAGHVNCQSGPQLKKTMSKYFHNVFMFSMNDEVVHTGYQPMAQYIIALCSNPKLASSVSG